MSRTKREARVGFKGLMGITGCLIGLGVVYFGYGMGKSSSKEAAVEPAPAAQPDRKRPVRTMNLALGNMVFFARDLGFTVTGAQHSDVDSNRIAARIEGQLQEIRELYRQEVTKNPALAGGLTLQFNIGPEGEVTQVRELSSRLNDADFRQAVAASVSKWSFGDLSGHQLQVRCPLLFVHHGMDITTLVQWEKSLAEAGEASAPVPASSPPPAVQPAAVAQTKAKEFQIKYATALRSDASFSSPSLGSLPAGTKLNVLRRRGDWLEVRAINSGPTGFVRKEFVTVVEVARR